MEEKLEIAALPVPEQRILSIRTDIELDALSSFIRSAAAELKAIASGGGETFTIYHRPVTLDADGTVEVCLALDAAATERPSRSLPAGEAAVAIVPPHRSRPPEIIDAFSEVERWIVEAGRCQAGPPREYCLNGDPGRIRIVWPLVPEDQPRPSAAL